MRRVSQGVVSVREVPGNLRAGSSFGPEGVSELVHMNTSKLLMCCCSWCKWRRVLVGHRAGDAEDRGDDG